jgi:hypothetical protein
MLCVMVSLTTTSLSDLLWAPCNLCGELSGVSLLIILFLLQSLCAIPQVLVLRHSSRGVPSANVTINPFPADVTNKRHLGSAPKSHLCDWTRKTEVIGLSDLMTLFIDLGCLYGNRRKVHSMFSKTQRLKIDSVDQKLFKIQLTRVLELLTRR